MEDRLRRYVENLFSETLPTKKAVELKEEMIQNLNDKYNDLVSEGKTQEAAYNIVIAGIGDISGLLDELKADTETTSPYMTENEYERKRSAMLTAISVMMYILSPLTLIVLALFGSPHVARIGVPILFVFISGATGLLIFNAMTKPKYSARSETMVEEFREWQSETKDKRALRRAISSALWAIVVVLYFIISFSTNAWHISWIIFLLGAAAEAFINMFFAIKK